MPRSPWVRKGVAPVLVGSLQGLKLEGLAQPPPLTTLQERVGHRTVWPAREVLPQSSGRCLVIDQFLACPRSSFPGHLSQRLPPGVPARPVVATRVDLVDITTFKTNSLKLLSSVSSFEHGAYHAGWCPGLPEAPGSEGWGAAVSLAGNRGLSFRVHDCAARRPGTTCVRRATRWLGCRSLFSPISTTHRLLQPQERGHTLGGLQPWTQNGRQGAGPS